MTMFEKISSKDIRNIIAVLFTIAAVLFIYVLVWKAVPDGNKDLINVIGGSVLAGMNQILSYYFGSSKEKTDETKNSES